MIAIVPLVPILLRTSYADDPVFRGTHTVFTIHNIGYQGLFPPDTLPLLMLPWDLFAIDKMEFWGKANFLKGALVFSDHLTTVSRKYSWASRTPATTPPPHVNASIGATLQPEKAPVMAAAAAMR